jgi:type II secretory pathway component PulM
MALVGLVGGCCSNPGVFQKLEHSLKTVQGYYEPLLSEDLMNDKVRQAVVAADTTLLLAGELQAQWCPPVEAVKQVELQTAEAKKLAAEAGVQAPEVQPEPQAVQ